MGRFAYKYAVSCLKGNFVSSDSHIDGKDMVAYILEPNGVDLENFVVEFGIMDCTSIKLIKSNSY